MTLPDNSWIKVIRLTPVKIEVFLGGRGLNFDNDPLIETLRFGFEYALNHQVASPRQIYLNMLEINPHSCKNENFNVL